MDNSSISTFSFEAQLALAAYGLNLTPGSIAITANTDSLKNVGMVLPQVTSINDINIVQQYDDAASGASMTLFQRNGEYVLAVRGTEIAADDLTADLLLAAGIPADLNPQFIVLKDKLDEWVGNKGDSPLIPVGTSFTVTGHSLGGYLASALKGAQVQAADGTLTPEFNISDAYLFNSPGTNGILGELYDSYQKVFGFAPPGTAGIWNIQAEQGPSMTAGLGTQLSAPIGILGEDGATPFSNHSITPLTATLAVMATYATLGGTADVLLLNAIDNESGVNVGSTPDSMLDALRRVLLPAGVKATSAESYVELYQNLADLQKTSTYTSLQGHGTLINVGALSTAQMLDYASADTPEGAAVRHAMSVLSPVAVVGTGSTDEAYSQYPVEYWQTRAAMLDRLDFFALKDKAAYDPKWNDYSNPNNSVYDNESHAWFDAQTGLNVERGAIFPSTQFTYFGTAAADTLSGAGMADVLFGLAGNDTLKGGAGDDMLVGGAGDDSLFGGAGSDTYIYVRGDGNDTIFAGTDAGADGPVDHLVMENINVADVTITRPNSYDLLIKYAGATITVSNWFTPTANGTSYQLKDITFADGVRGTDELSKLAQTVFGTDGVDTLYANTTFGETLVGGHGNDTLIGGSREDTYIYRPGDGSDRINAGTNSNQSTNGAGAIDHLIMDGIASDAVSFTHNGNDLYVDYAGERITVQSWYALGGLGANYRLHDIQFADQTLATATITQLGLTMRGTDGADTLRANGGWDNILYGGKGADTLYGDTGNDTLYGGPDNDVLNGGTGNDLYRVFLGEGTDRILDSSGFDTVDFGGLDLATVQFLHMKDNSLEVRVGDDTLAHIDSQFASNGPVIEDFMFGGQHYTWQSIGTLAVTVA